MIKSELIAKLAEENPHLTQRDIERVVGVVLSGALDDGAGGLTAVKQQGGVTVAQDPDEALVASMPRSAIRFDHVDHVLPIAGIAALLTRLAGSAAPERGLES